MRRLYMLLGTAALGACGGPTAPAHESRSEMRWVELGKPCPASAPATSLADAARDSLAPVPPSYSPDAYWASVALEVPGGWGGFFLDAGTPTIYLVDPTQREAALARLAAEPIPITAATRVRSGRWDYAQLFDWYRYLQTHLWGIGGLSSTDLQEARNRIEIGVVDEAARGEVERRLAALDIPCYLAATDIRPMLRALSAAR